MDELLALAFLVIVTFVFLAAVALLPVALAAGALFYLARWAYWRFIYRSHNAQADPEDNPTGELRDREGRIIQASISSRR